MKDKVRVHVWGSWLSAGGRKTELVDWEPGMTAEHLVPPDKAGVKGLQLFLNRAPCGPTTKVYPGDHVDVAVQPQDPVSAAALWGWFAGSSIFLQVGIGAAAIFGLNKLISLIIGTPKPPKQKGDEESAHGSWSGVQNVRVEGQPRSVIYGEFRVAPTILDEFIVTTPFGGTNNKPTSTLYTLGSLGEGPVYSIGDQTFDNAVETALSSEDPDNPIPTGIQVNENNLENYRNVDVHVRMGANEQDPIPGFEQIVTDYAVGATLLQEETATASGNLTLNPDLELVTTPYNSNAAAAQAVWDAYGFTFDMKVPADQFTALVEFPGGLCSIGGSGNLNDAGFRLLMRYMELDDLGDAIESGGDNGDGWVYAYPEPMYLADTQQPFGKEYTASLLDPQTYVPGALGRACFFNGTSDYASTNLGANDSILNQPATFAAGTALDEITIVGWVEFNSLPASGGSAFRPLIEISDPTAPNRGIALMVNRIVGPWSTAWAPVAYIGNGTTVPEHYHAGLTVNIPPGTLGFQHVAMTYKKIDATHGRVSLYLNRVLAFSETFTGGACVSAGKALEMARSRTFEATSYSSVQMDEWKVYNRELTATEIALDYDGGVGLYGTAEADLVAGWHFEETIGVTTAQDYGTYAGVSSQNDLKMYSTAGDGAVGTGHVHPPGTGEVKRSRYRVECLRLNLKSSSSFVQDESVWSLLYGKISEVLAYPSLALIATKIRANDQLSGQAPKTTVLTKGVLCPIWDGASTTNPSISYEWTKNPAWICLDIATSTRYGHGGEYDFFTVDLESVKEWADYCDALIWDNRDNRQTIDEADTDYPIEDLRYNSTLFGGFGGIEIHFRTTPSVVVPPRRWAPGRFVGFTGIPAPTGAYTVDINTSNIDGFEIGEVNFSTNWQVVLRYDKATYGHPWTDGGFLGTILALTGVAEGRERRFEYSWVHDTFKSFWDTLIDVAATARAVPMRDGRILRFKVEKPRTAVGLIGMGSIKPGSFEMGYSGQATRVNSIQADFWDEDKNYERSNTSFDDPDLEGSAAEDEITRESITVEGITRRSQMRRDCYFRIQAHKLLTRDGKFRTGLEALPFETGDVLQLAHDVVSWGLSGRVLAGATTTTVKLDREVTLAAATTYYLRVRTTGQALAADGTVIDKYETGTVSTAAGTYAAGTNITVSIAYTFTPAKDDTYCLYTAGEEFLVQIIGATQTEDFEREIEWVQYDADVYAVDELPEPLRQE